MPEVENITPYSDNRAKDEQVRSMFDAIAPAYDFMNRAMTAGLDRVWLKHLVTEVVAAAPASVIDMATGTGDVAFAIAKSLPKARITGLDLSEGMLDKARAKVPSAAPGCDLRFLCGDATATGLPAGCADVITVAYGVRNFADIAAGYREMFRLLRPGGKLCVLELSTPPGTVTKALYRLYTSTLIPAAGRLFSHDVRAYSYLPESIAAAPQRTDMAALMLGAGFINASFRSFTFGACTLYTAFKPHSV